MPDTQTAKSLREKRAKLIAEARAKYIELPEKENRQPNAEEEAGWAKLMGSGQVIEPEKRDQHGNVIQAAKYDHGEEGRLLEQINRLERQEATEASLKEVRNLNGTPAGGDLPPEHRHLSEKGKRARKAEARQLERMKALAFQAWAGWQARSRGGQDMTPEQEEACKVLDYKPQRQTVSIGLPSTDDYRNARRDYMGGREFRAGNVNPQGIGITTAGGYTVPEGFVNNLEVALLQYGGIRQVADVMRTMSGQDLPWPNVNDTTVKGSRVSENTTVTTKDVTFGAVVFHAYKYTSGIVLVPAELMEDSAFNMAALLGELLGIRIGRILADEFTNTGAGAAPSGIVDSSSAADSNAASATAIAGDDLYMLKHSVDPAYRTGGGVGWMFHDKILLAIKKLKDGLGRYLWQASLAGSRPDTLDGDPIYINQSMTSTISSGKKTVLYGKFDKYKIRDVAEVRLRRLVERFADADQEAFLMFSRHDGQLLDAGTHPVKYLQH